MASRAPRFYNALFQTKFISGFMKLGLGIHPKRSLPTVSKSYSSWRNFSDWLDEHEYVEQPIKTVYVLVDEFINYLESDIAIDLEVLFEALNYKVQYISNLESSY